jgi:hypothetical protein
MKAATLLCRCCINLARQRSSGRTVSLQCSSSEQSYRAQAGNSSAAGRAQGSGMTPSSSASSSRRRASRSSTLAAAAAAGRKSRHGQCSPTLLCLALQRLACQETCSPIPSARPHVQAAYKALCWHQRRLLHGHKAGATAAPGSSEITAVTG